VIRATSKGGTIRAPAVGRGRVFVSAVKTFLRQHAGLAVLVCSLTPAIPSAAQTVAEPALKAAFLVNFVRFTQWSTTAIAPGAPVVLCVSDGAVAEALEGIAAEQVVDGRPLVVRRTALDASWTGCALAYVHRLDKRGARHWLTGVPAGVLTVSDADNFATEGGIIQLFAVDGRMRFAINVDEADRRGIRLSAKLLQLARIVRD
jgi:hypothetical protein